MKVLCPQCDRLSELEQYRLDNGVLVITCTKCGVASRAESGSTPVPTVMTPIPSAPRLLSTPGASNVVLLKTASSEAVEKAAVAAQNNPFAVPAGACPKCLVRRPETAESCGQCGLVFAIFEPSSVEPPSWLADSWVTLLQRWGDEAAHDKVRREAMSGDALAAIGRLYRLRLASMPDDPYALRGREEVVRMASAPVAMRATQSSVGPPPTSTFKAVFIGIVIVGCMLAIGFLLRTMFTGRGEP